MSQWSSGNITNCSAWHSSIESSPVSVQTQSLAFLAVFVYATHATQAIAFEWKLGFTLWPVVCLSRTYSLHTLTTVLRSTEELSILSGTVNDYQPLCCVIINGRYQSIGGLKAQVGWLDLRVGSRLALSYIQQLNRVNSHNNFVWLVGA